MKAPPDIQVSWLLWYLGTALRGDIEIQKWTEARPEEIIASTAEHAPIDVGGGRGRLFLTNNQMPALCLNILSERHKGVPGTGIIGGPNLGREFKAMLWYVFRPFESEGYDMHGLTKGDRLCTLIWWRLKHHLAKQKLGSGFGPSFDLQRVSGIRTIDPLTESTERVMFDIVQGIKIPLTVWHGKAPYSEVVPPTLEMVELAITSKEGSGVGVEADVDL
jgi:hypothetical protein